MPGTSLGGGHSVYVLAKLSHSCTAPQTVCSLNFLQKSGFHVEKNIWGEGKRRGKLVKQY